MKQKVITMSLPHSNNKPPKNNSPMVRQSLLGVATPQRRNHPPSITSSLSQEKTKSHSEGPILKRYMMLVQHEVIVYGEDEQAAKRTLLTNKFMKDRINLQCVFIQELPLPGDEPMIPIIDVRTAPGS